MALTDQPPHVVRALRGMTDSRLQNYLVAIFDGGQHLDGSIVISRGAGVLL